MSDESVATPLKSVQDLIQEALDAGQSPREIRLKLQTLGVRWNYSARTQGTRETLRRKRQGHLCANGCGGRADWVTNPICYDCRLKNWQ